MNCVKDSSTMQLSYGNKYTAVLESFTRVYNESHITTSKTAKSVLCLKSDEWHANMQISPAKAIKAASIKIGTHVLEQSYLHRYLGNNCTFHLMSNGLCLPGVELHIEWDPTQKLTVTYDVVKVEPVNGPTQYLYCKEQFADFHTSTPGVNSYKFHLKFTGQCSTIFAFVPSNTKKVELLLNGKSHNLIFTKRKSEQFGKYYELTPIDVNKLYLDLYDSDSVVLSVQTRNSYAPPMNMAAIALSPAVVNITQDVVWD